jgi:hypothetical protein
MSTGVTFFIFLFTSYFVTAQYPEGSGKYNEAIIEGRDNLEELISEHPDVEFIIHPDRKLIDSKIYTFEEPENEDYTIGIIMDPVGCFEYRQLL